MWHGEVSLLRFHLSLLIFVFRRFVVLGNLNRAAFIYSIISSARACIEARVPRVFLARVLVRTEIRHCKQKYQPKDRHAKGNRRDR